MIKKLIQIQTPCKYHIIHNEIHMGCHRGIKGDSTNIYGDTTRIYGDVSHLFGDVTFISGDVTNLRGVATNMFGSIESCQISDDEWVSGVSICELY